MGFLTRRERAAPGPAWAPFFVPDDAAAFLSEVGRAADAHGIQHVIDASEGTATFVYGDLHGDLRFANLATRCADAPRDQWRETVEDHFDTLLASLNPAGSDVTYEEARSLLKLRLWDSEIVTDAGLYHDVADGLRAVVCLDLPSTIEAISGADIERWDIAEDELFAIAADNVRSAADFALGEHDLGDGVVICAARGDSYFTSTHALWPDQLVGDLGEHGAIVAVPTRHTVLVYPIRGPEVQVAVGTLLELTGRLYADGPGSLRPDIYWWNGESLMTQHALVDDDGTPGLGVSAPFRDLLNRLSP